MIAHPRRIFRTPSHHPAPTPGVEVSSPLPRRSRLRRTRRRNRVIAGLSVLVAATAAISIGTSGAYFTGASSAVRTTTTASLPAVTGLTATANAAGGSDLSWSAPNLSAFGDSSGTSASYTVKRSVTNEFGDGARATTLPSGSTGTLSTDTSLPASLNAREGAVVEANSGNHGVYALIGGKVYGWGLDAFMSNQTSPLAIAGITEEVTSISSGIDFVCALTASRRVFCAGGNGYGQLGVGDTTTRSSFVEIASYSAFKGESVVQVEAGGYFVCALGASGTVACWGAGGGGQLGMQGNTANQTRPVTVAQSNGAVPTAFATYKPVQLAAGGGHVCAVKGRGPNADGDLTLPPTGETVACWGSNNGNQLGANASASTDQPINVRDTSTPRLTGITKISATRATTCVVNNATSGVNIACWGQNPSGQLGDGTTSNSALPVAVQYAGAGAAPSDFIDVAIGGEYGCGLRATSFACWGTNSNGQFGNSGSTSAVTRMDTPRSVSAIFGQVKLTSLAAGAIATCASTERGGIACWGNNQYGQLAQGTTSGTVYPVPTPVLLSGTPMQPSQSAKVLASGNGAQFSAMIMNGEVSYWGTPNDVLAPTTPVLPRKTEPSVVAGFPSDVNKLAAGFDHLCAATPAGEVWCLGSNSSGELGNGTTTNSATTPVKVSDPNSLLRGKTIVGLDAGSGFTCALLSDGAIVCWGSNAGKQLGAATTAANSSTPVTVIPAAPSSGPFAGTGKKPIAIALGEGTVCASKEAGGAACWGANSDGELGGSGTVGTSSATPLEIIDSTASGSVVGTGAMKAIDGGYHTFCAIASSGRVYCWGRNVWGTLGNGSTTSTKDLTPISSSASFTGVTVGTRVACAWNTGNAGCWGANNNSEMGGNDTDSSFTARVPRGVNDANGFIASGIASIATGWQHSCLLTTSGAVACWGANQYYAGGQKANTPATLPTPTVVKVANTVVNGTGTRFCMDGATLVQANAACTLSPQRTYYYQVTYQVPGVDKWRSASASVLRG